MTPRRERFADIHPDWTEPIVGAAIEVHRELGPGLLESTYQACLAHELRSRSIPFVRELPLPISYKGLLLESFASCPCPSSTRASCSSVAIGWTCWSGGA
ncbi:MAG: GxxExxY protein [Planctomycetes bacterium]|nr:GxxExxY protein [Planctomycetota bacterium]